MTRENPEKPAATRTQSRGEAMSGLDRIRKAARGDKTQRLNNLMHHVTVDLLRESYHALKHDAAAGVDEVTWHQYGEGLEARLAGLHERAQSGRYRPKPSKRTYIPKADGRQRPIGIAALEDKVLQRAASQVLGAIWEEDFANFSYGFRPGRSRHNALDALWVGITQRKANWVLDADIRSCFDTPDHGGLMKFVEHRVADPRMQNLIRGWLRAGVSEDGEWTRTSLGTPQGAVISPLLANLYLHYVLDLWVKRWRNREARGEVIIVRYADDFVMGFQHKDDAERCLAELRERFAKFGLELHQEKTRLIEFGRFAIENREKRGAGRPETINFLGFTQFHAHLRASPQGRKVHGLAKDDRQADAGETARDQRRTHAPATPTRSRTGTVASRGGAGVLQLSRRARQHPRNERLSRPGQPLLAPRPETAQPERQVPELGENAETDTDLDSSRPVAAPIPEPTPARQLSKVGAV